MQRLKKYLKFFCHDEQRCGGDKLIFYEGDTKLMGFLPSPPHQGKPSDGELAISYKSRQQVWGQIFILIPCF